MLSRQMLLRLMIGCLALTALAGVAGVFLDGWDLLGRVMGTAVAGAVTAIAMMRVSTWMERPEFNRMGLAGMAMALVQFVLAFAAIWVSWLNVFHSEWRLWGTLFAVSVTGWPAVRLLGALNWPSVRNAARVALVLDAGVLLFLLLGVWQPSGSPLDDELFGTAAILAGHGVVACACLMGFQTGDKKYWRWLGVVSTTLAGVIFTYGLWAHLGGEPKIPIAILSLGIFIAHANMVAFVPLKANQNVLRLLTSGFTFVTLVLIDWLIFHDDRNSHGALPRLAGATGILAICGTLALIVLARLNRGMASGKPDQPDDADQALPKVMKLNCPVCAKEQTAKIGGHSCEGCGLLINVQIESPRCLACGYSLLHRHVDSCPECGAKLATK